VCLSIKLTWLKPCPFAICCRATAAAPAIPAFYAEFSWPPSATTNVAANQFYAQPGATHWHLFKLGRAATRNAGSHPDYSSRNIVWESLKAGEPLALLYLGDLYEQGPRRNSGLPASSLCHFKGREPPALRTATRSLVFSTPAHTSTFPVTQVGSEAVQEDPPLATILLGWLY